MGRFRLGRSTIRRRQPGERLSASSPYVKSLPDWARRFLREGAAQSVQSMGTARTSPPPPPRGRRPVDGSQLPAPGGP